MTQQRDDDLSAWIASIDDRVSRLEQRDARLAAWIAERAKLAKTRKGRDIN